MLIGNGLWNGLGCGQKFLALPTVHLCNFVGNTLIKLTTSFSTETIRNPCTTCMKSSPHFPNFPEISLFSMSLSREPTLLRWLSPAILKIPLLQQCHKLNLASSLSSFFSPSLLFLLLSFSSNPLISSLLLCSAGDDKAIFPLLLLFNFFFSSSSFSPSLISLCSWTLLVAASSRPPPLLAVLTVGAVGAYNFSQSKQTLNIIFVFEYLNCVSIDAWL